MDILKLLKKLQRIEADPGYVRRSRILILKSKPNASPFPITFSRILMNSLEMGTTVVLTGLLIVLILGGFSAGRFLTPFQLSSLDPESLRAEANAIDIQVKLIGPAYPGIDFLESLINETSTIAVLEAPSKDKAFDIPKKGEAESNASSTEVTLEQALETLSR